MRKFRGFTVLLACIAVVAASLVVASTSAEAQPPQPTTAVPPIIGNTANGIVRDVPTKYYAAIDAFENTAIQEVLDTHNLPPSDAEAVKAWGRDAVRSQEYLDLLGIITKPAANRSDNEALVYEWFQGLYKDQQVAQAQAAVDQYLKWSGLTMDTITDDPIPEVLTGTGDISTDTGYCNFRPPKPLDNKNGMFDGTYNPTDLPQCNGQHAGNEPEVCAGLATGCPVPWPTVEQFQQWGRYVSQQNLFESVVFVNQALEISTGVGLAATMAATGVGTALSRAYLAVPTSGAGLFAKVFPYSARAWSIGADVATEAAVSAARAAAGIIRVGAAAMVVGTVITAIVTIVLESLTIAEHRKIPVTLLDGLAQAKAAVPDLGAIATTDGGPGALLTTFLSTTQIDVDPDCVLPSPDRFYSSFPCANAPAPAAATSTDDRFYVTNDASGDAAGELRGSIYAVDPIDSTTAASADESVRLSGNGWFVTTKYDGSKVENHAAPVTPGATMQNLRLSYRDWDGRTVDAERIQDANGHPTFALTILDKDYVGPCSTPPTGGAISPCLTDTIRYVQPDGTKASARVLTASDAEPDIAAVVPSRAVAGVPITLSATATSSFGSDGPFFYRWTVQGETLEGASVPATINLAGTIPVKLEVIDNNGVTVATRFYPVLVAQTTQIGVGFYPPSPAAYGSAPMVWAGVNPTTTQGVQCTWNQTTGVIGCVNPTGVVQFFVDGSPAGDPVPVTRNSSPCLELTNCQIFIGFNAEYTPAIALPGLTGAAGTHHTVTATYYGDDKFVGSTGTEPFDVVAATPDVALTSGTTYPSPTQPVTLTATVRPKPGSTGVPTGTVSFFANGSSMPLAPAVPVDSDGTATLNVATLKFVTGLVVRYSGDANFAPTDSTSYPISFSPQPSSATVQPASSTAPVGSNVDVKVTILDDAGNPVPGASVSLSPGGATGQTGSDGTTTLTVSSAVPGPVTYTVSANGTTNLGSATVTYVNPAPTASATSASTNEDTVVTVPPLGSGGDGNALTYAVTQPTNGSAAVTPQGLVYTPNANFFGTDSFTYTASDGSLTSAPATVTVTVNPVDDPPVGQDTIVTTAEDTPVSILPTATDPDSPVTFQLLSGPAHGTITGSLAPWEYTPDANYTGTDSFNYAIGGGGYIVGKTVYITVTPVNDAPTVADTSATTDEDTAKVITPPTNDVDGDEVTVKVTSGPAHGTVVHNAANAFLYTPAHNYSGPDSFTYTASDGSLTSAPATVTVTVNPVNDPPTVSPIGNVTGVYSDAIAPITVTASDVDSGTNLTWSQTGLPAGLTLAGLGGSATISGTVTAAPGPYPVTVKACDSSNACGTSSFTVTVAPETATVRLTQNNPQAVATVRGAAPAMTFTGRVTDAADGSFGDVNRIQPANLSLQLVPIDGGNPVACSVKITRRVLATTTAPGFVDLSCSFPAGVKVDVYDVVLTASGSFAGSVDSVLAVYDPQGRGASGVGVVDLGGGNRGEYAFAAASGSNGARGTVVYLEKDAQGNVVHRLFAPSVQALVVSGSTLPITASITGKAVVDGVSNYGLIVTVVDGGASGDKFGLRVTGPPGAPSRPSLTFAPKPVIAPGVITVR